MRIKHYAEVPVEIPKMEGVKGTTLRWLIAKNDGAKNYAMRLFELEPAGVIPMHDHNDTEHEIFIVEGSAILKTADKEVALRPGMAIFVEPGDRHSFVNNSKKPFKFLCIVPIARE